MLCDMADPASESGSRSLSARTAAGAGWMYLSAAFHAVGQVLYTVVMARLVSPRAFGLFAMAWLFHGFGSQLSQLGIGQALIQRPSLSHRDIRAGFTLSVALGTAFMVLFWFLAPLIATFFNERDVTPLVRALAAAFFLSSLCMTPAALLQREFRFRELALVSMTAFFIGYFIVGIGSAIAGAGVWSLVAAPMTAAVVFGALTYAKTRHPIKPIAEREALASIAGYGGQLSLINVMEFGSRNVDTFVVGRYATASLLGQYNRAFNLVVVSLSYLSGSLMQVLISGFSLVQTNVQRLRRGFVSSVAIAATLLFPIAAGIGVAAHELVLVGLGDRWLPAADVVPFLAGAGAFMMISQLYGTLCESLARHGARIFLQFLYLLGLVGMMLAVAGGPLWRYAAVFLIGEVLRHLGFLVIARRFVGLSASDLVGAYARPLIGSSRTSRD